MMVDASSVLTEEPEPGPEMVEMDPLEAELKSELQKLSEVNFFRYFYILYLNYLPVKGASFWPVHFIPYLHFC